MLPLVGPARSMRRQIRESYLVELARLRACIARRFAFQIAFHFLEYTMSAYVAHSTPLRFPPADCLPCPPLSPPVCLSLCVSVSVSVSLSPSPSRTHAHTRKLCSTRQPPRASNAPMYNMDGLVDASVNILDPTRAVVA